MELQHWVRTPEPGRKMAVRDEGKYCGGKVKQGLGKKLYILFKARGEMEMCQKKKSKM